MADGPARLPVDDEARGRHLLVLPAGPGPDDVGTLVRNKCVEAGLIMRATGDRMLFSPPLVISHAEVDQMIDITRKGLEHAWKVMTA